MATIISGYNEFAMLLGTGLIDFSTEFFKLALLDDTYTPDVASHTVWADVEASEIDSATYTNYVDGGTLLTTTTYTLSGGTGVFNADDITWAGNSITCRYAVLYVDATLSTYVKPLVYYVLFDDSPSDVSRTDFTVKWATAGVITIPKSS